MAVETADDLAIFFDAEEYGEAAAYTAPGVSAELVVIRNAGTAQLQLGQSFVEADSLTFDLRADVVTPVPGGMLSPPAGPIPERALALDGAYRIIGSPRRTGKGAFWTCEAERA